MEHATEQLAPLFVEQVSYLWLIPLFPLVGAAINATLGLRIQRALGKAAVHAIAIGAMIASTAVAVYAFGQMLGMPADQRFLQDTLWNLLTAGRLSVDLGFSLDQLSMTMVLIVTVIGTLIHLFSVGYMADEQPYWRFFAWMNLFAFSMLLLVMGDNFALMFFGWEGVGLCSYLLISYYYTDPEKAAAGMKAFVVNRIGDFGFLAGLFLLFWSLGGSWAPGGPLRGGVYEPTPGLNAMAPATSAPQAVALAPAVDGVRVGPTLNFRELRDEIAVEKTGVKEHLLGSRIWGFGLLAVVCILLFVGAMGKSAQIPLYVWLPDAMAGPTPVSALIHAATMVTAGVYMVARLNFLFALSPSAMGWVALVGATTAAFAATIGLFQYDIKKVLAYSTVSQLGFMFIGVGVGAYWAGVYHLLTHAFFKATLFLGSGSVILGCHHEQDMRKMGGLGKLMPVTRWTYLAATWAIAGFPWAAGFYSKDEILWKAFTARDLALFGHPTPWLGPAIYLVGIVTATGTSFYMFRSYYMTFTGPYRGGGGEHGAHAPAPGAVHAAADGHGHHGGTPRESPLSITFVLVVLAAGAVLAGLLGLPALWTHRPPALERWLEPVMIGRVSFAAEPHALEWLFQAIGFGAGAAGWLFARTLYKDGRSAIPDAMRERWKGLWTVVYNKYYVDEIYGAAVVLPTLLLAKLLSWFDGAVIDRLVNLAGALARAFASVDGAIDRYVVDGAVNAVAEITIEGGRALRRIQTGRIQTYLYGALAGGLAVILINFLIR